MQEVDKEFDRINSISELKKTSGDTLIRTVHFVKKAVMVPITLKKDE